MYKFPKNQTTDKSGLEKKITDQHITDSNF
jgi:hypothetical protein